MSLTSSQVNKIVENNKNSNASRTKKHYINVHLSGDLNLGSVQQRNNAYFQFY